MKTIYQKPVAGGYYAPTIKVHDFRIECGFATSDVTSYDNTIEDAAEVDYGTF